MIRRAVSVLPRIEARHALVSVGLFQTGTIMSKDGVVMVVEITGQRETKEAELQTKKPG
jgi:hypothetical protein